MLFNELLSSELSAIVDVLPQEASKTAHRKAAVHPIIFFFFLFLIFAPFRKASVFCPYYIIFSSAVKDFHFDKKDACYRAYCPITGVLISDISF
jgi:hypothetical protein